MGLFGCGPAVVALTTGLPLPMIGAAIVRGGADPEAIPPGELASAYAKLADAGLAHGAIAKEGRSPVAVASAWLYFHAALGTAWKQEMQVLRVAARSLSTPSVSLSRTWRAE
jgi:hypothetical protein